jgi:LysM repeat protein
VHGGIQINNLKETYYRDRFLGARRILPDFLPEVDADSAAVASLVDLLAHSVVETVDTLALSPADRRVILFADGTWAVVDSLGGLSVPASNERLVLAEGGSWRAVTPSTVRIPVLKESTAEEKKSSSSSSSSSSTKTTAPPPPADGSAVYHTIVSGDTLSGLARKYGTSVQTLCNLNGMTVKSTLRVGKKIRVK